MTNKKSEAPAEFVEEVDIVEPETVDEKTALELLDDKLRNDELLADMPELKDPIKLRIRERNALLELVIRAEKITKDENADDVDVKMAAMNLMAGIDEFAESIAVDKNAYVEWSVEQEYESFMALLSRYSASLGKPNSSAN